MYGMIGRALGHSSWRFKGRLASTAMLGLPTALLAHAMVFGSGHAVAGAAHSVALAAGAAALLLVLALRSKQAAEGTVVAARLRALAPSLAGLMIAAAAWFALLELTRARAYHSAPRRRTGAARSLHRSAIGRVHTCAMDLRRGIGYLRGAIPRFGVRRATRLPHFSSPVDGARVRAHASPVFAAAAAPFLKPLYTHSF